MMISVSTFKSGDKVFGVGVDGLPWLIGNEAAMGGQRRAAGGVEEGEEFGRRPGMQRSAT